MLLTGTCVYWAPKDNRTKEGLPQYEDPIELRCNWQAFYQLLRSPTGEEFNASAMVFTSSNVKHRGRLWQGKLTDLPQNAPPPSDSFEIWGFGSMRNYAGEETSREAIL